jgi:Tfp pilus assembly protein PilF
MSPQARAALAHTVAGLRHLGLGEKDQARTEFEKALEAMPDSLVAHTELEALQTKAGQ